MKTWIWVWFDPCDSSHTLRILTSPYLGSLVIHECTLHDIHAENWILEILLSTMLDI